MDKKYMDLAFKCAEKAFEINEVPVGAVIVKDGKVISTGYNMKEINCSVLEHAELIAIREAEKILQNWRLDGCDIYVTLDPCPMCSSAIKQARISHVYSALQNSDDSNYQIIKNIFMTDKTNPSVSYVTNLFPDQSKKLLNLFFVNKRN